VIKPRRRPREPTRPLTRPPIPIADRLIADQTIADRTIADRPIRRSPIADRRFNRRWPMADRR
jgi:hypothetical protein